MACDCSGRRSKYQLRTKCVVIFLCLEVVLASGEEDVKMKKKKKKVSPVIVGAHCRAPRRLVQPAMVEERVRWDLLHRMMEAGVLEHGTSTGSVPDSGSGLLQLRSGPEDLGCFKP